MTILKPKYEYMFITFINTYAMLRSLYKNTSLPAFLVRGLLLNLIIVMQLSLVELLQKYNLRV